VTLAVIDTSIAFKWIVDEGDRARAIEIGRTHDLIAPDLIDLEIWNALWTRVRRQELSRDLANQAFLAFKGMKLDTRSVAPLLDAARALTLDLDATIYDCVFWALALDTGARLATADMSFVSKLRRSGERRVEIIIL
jgi:predicted nucleic acid-binding protein